MHVNSQKVQQNHHLNNGPGTIKDQSQMKYIGTVEYTYTDVCVRVCVCMCVFMRTGKSGINYSG